MSRIGTKINSLRTMKGMTRKQLASAVGVSENFIGDVEAGKRVLNDELLKRIIKILEQDTSELTIYEGQEGPAAEKTPETTKKMAERQIQEIWNDVLYSVLKPVPVYDYSLKKVLNTRHMPVVSNKIEGFPKDKVLFLEIQDNDMVGFRMMKGDIAFGYLSGEIEGNAICLVEYNGQRAVRQVKRLDSSKVLLVSNKGTLATETLYAKDVKVLAKLERLELKL